MTDPSQTISPLIIFCLASSGLSWLESTLRYLFGLDRFAAYIDGHDFVEIKTTKKFENLKCQRCGYVSRTYLTSRRNDD